MPTLVLLAGPNGAGKTTFINGFLRRRAEVFRYVNPDEVARGLSGAGAGRDLAAGRLVLERLNALFAERYDVVLETTLASRSHAVRVRDWKAAGYRVELVYLRPPSADFSVMRVARRVAQGGHGIPEETLRRRFALSLDYLETVYKPSVDQWEVYAVSDNEPDLLDWDRNEHHLRPRNHAEGSARRRADRPHRHARGKVRQVPSAPRVDRPPDHC